MFTGQAERAITTRDQALNEIRGNGKCGRALGGIEYTEAAAGSRTYVEQAPTALEALREAVDHARDGRQLRTHGMGHALIFVIDDFEHAQRG